MLERIEQYKILKLLSKGPVASVYLTKNTITQQKVVLKQLSRLLVYEEKFRERFRREVRTTQDLRHSAIVPVHDWGEWNDVPFFVMRHMEGGSLADLLVTKRRFSLHDTIQILYPIVQALDWAHEKQVAHRDLKPSNILFNAGQRNAFLSDFGVAKLMAEGPFTIGDRMIGTPYYISPEQARGDAITHRCDIYSLGVIVFEMLTGKRPYEPVNKGIVSLVFKHMYDPVPNILGYRPDLPKETQYIVERAMAKAPEDRYDNAGQIIKDLNKIQLQKFMDDPRQEVIMV